MHKFSITQRVFLTVFILLYGCGGNPDVQVNELSNNTTSYDETIHMNNCGGKADSKQTASRSFSTNTEGGIEVGVQQMVEGVISAKYSQYRNDTKSLELVAPPGTNMEFVLRWKDEVHAGNVSVNGKAGAYTVNIPIAVEQVSSQDLGCNGVVTMPQSTALPSVSTLQPNVLTFVGKYDAPAPSARNFQIPLAAGEIIVGQCWEFITQEQHYNNGVVFLLRGPYQFDFTVIDGWFAIYKNASYDNGESLLKGQIDTFDTLPTIVRLP